jgi:AAA15 family ATPase/GTPase
VTSYTTLEVQNFKGIREMTLEGLGMVNVFVGGNNVGKTSVLQTILLTEHFVHNSFKAYANKSIQAILQEEDIPLWKKVAASEPEFFYKLNTSLEPMIKLHSKLLKFLSAEKYNRENPNEAIENKKEQKPLGDKPFRPLDELPQSDTFYYLSNEPSTWFNTCEALYERVIENKKETTIYPVLQKIEPQLKDVWTNGRTLLCDLGDNYPKRIPLGLMGEGFTKIFAMAVILKQIKGMVCIDEVENGFHWRVQKDMWRMVLHAAKEEGTQFFFTTHSYEVLESLNDVLQEMEANGESLTVTPHQAEDTETASQPLDLACVFHLKKDETDKVTAHKDSIDDLDFFIKSGVELR